MSATGTGLGIELGSSSITGTETRSSRLSTISKKEMQNLPGSLRSESSMRGLLQAEAGDSMVELDIGNGTSGFREGRRIVPDSMTPCIDSNSSTQRQSSASFDEQQTSLSRHGTLLSTNSTPTRNAEELKTILGNANSRLKPGASIVPAGAPTYTDRTDLEQAKPRARVEVDVIPESHICVQGGYLNGVVKIRIRERSRKESAVLISDGKLRVIGFECIQNQDHRHTFYQQSVALSSATPSSDRLFDSAPDDEGFYYAKEGVHSLPFFMLLPLDDGKGKPKGTIAAHAGISVRYIVMISVKVKERETDRRSIAHFYRDCEVWPRLNPSVILSPAAQPIRDTAAKNLFMGGSGKIGLTASLHRLHWIAGQQCCIKIRVVNKSRKSVKSLTLALLRSTVVFKPKAHLEVDDLDGEHDADACQTSTIQKQVAESTLEMGQRHGSRGHASAKGWWTGVHAGETVEFMHFLHLPPDSLSIARSRLLEVEYSVRVSINAGPLTSDVHVLLPIRIINFLSVDPPPTFSPPDQALLEFLGQKPLPGIEDDSFSHEYQTMSGRTLESLEEDEILEYDNGDCTDTHDKHSLSSSSVSEDMDTLNENKQLRQLGSIQARDDNDEFVQQAITSVRIDSKYGEHGGRFADLYYVSVQEELPDARSNAIKTGVSQSIVDPGTPRPQNESRIAPLHSRSSSSSSCSEMQRKPAVTRGFSSFADRVQQKLQAAEENRRACASTQDEEPSDIASSLVQGTNDEPSLSSRDTSIGSAEVQFCRSPQEGQNIERNQSATPGSYFRPRHDIPDEIERPRDGVDDELDHDADEPRFRFAELTRRASELSLRAGNIEESGSVCESSSENRLQDIGSVAEPKTETENVEVRSRALPTSLAQFRHTLPQHDLDTATSSTSTSRETSFHPKAQTLSGQHTPSSCSKVKYSTQLDTQVECLPAKMPNVTNSVKDMIRQLEERAKV